MYVIIRGDKQSLPRTHYKDLLKEHLRKRKKKAVCLVDLWDEEMEGEEGERDGEDRGERDADEKLESREN